MLLENLKLFFNQLNTKTEQTIARIMFQKALTISVAESCTGGLISSRLTDISGSSLYIKENYITYANEAKIKLLGVKEETLNKFGAVSEECAQEMAEGLFEKLKSSGTGCDITLSITGIAGPTGATEDKKVGLVYIAIKNKYKLKIKKVELDPRIPRKTMKYMFSQKALDFLIDFLKEIENN